TGMPDEIRRRIFDPFYSTKGSRGSGLGLWVSREIITRHDGYIEVHTAPGEGSTFIVALPKVHSSAPGSPVVPQPARPRRLR
ncbi:MAG: hypothetical protein C4345_11455, partial [Chloroflexota bacterium]